MTQRLLPPSGEESAIARLARSGAARRVSVLRASIAVCAATAAFTWLTPAHANAIAKACTDGDNFIVTQTGADKAVANAGACGLASADLSTGELRATASGSFGGPGGSSFAFFSDSHVTIHGPAAPVIPITVSLAVDGSASFTQTFGKADFQSDLSVRLGSNPSQPGLFQQGFASVEAVPQPDGTLQTITHTDIGLFPPNVLPGSASAGFQSKIPSNIAALMSININLPGDNPTYDFTAELALNTNDDTGFKNAPGNVFWDFSHTASFGIALPPGYTFTSQSGVLLTAVTVPEPSSLALVVGGLLFLGRMPRRKSS